MKSDSKLHLLLLTSHTDLEFISSHVNGPVEYLDLIPWDRSAVTLFINDFFNRNRERETSTTGKAIELLIKYFFKHSDLYIYIYTCL